MQVSNIVFDRPKNVLKKPLKSAYKYIKLFKKFLLLLALEVCILSSKLTNIFWNLFTISKLIFLGYYNHILLCVGLTTNPITVRRNFFFLSILYIKKNVCPYLERVYICWTKSYCNYYGFEVIAFYSTLYITVNIYYHIKYIL